MNRNTERQVSQAVEMIQIPKDEYEALKGVIAALTAKVTELEARQNKTSKNSSKPPSSDGLKKDAIKNNRKPSNRPSGGQKGHEGVTKELTPSPDRVVELAPKTECECGGKIIDSGNHTVRQQTDLQPATVVTVEYRAKEGACSSCGKTHKAGFPAGVNGTASYGPMVRSLVTYLTGYQLLPLKRATEMVEDLLGLKDSQGTVVSATQEAHEKLSEAEGRIKEEIIGSDVAHYDESGMRVCGKTWWLHCAGTETATCYSIHEKRGKEAMDAMGILPFFEGTAIHDHWKSYYHYDNCAHAECNQHHLRTLNYLHENLGQAWAFEMACLLGRISRHVELCKAFGAHGLCQADIEEYEGTYRRILAGADRSENAPVEARRMANRLEKYEQETLLFMLDFDVPFTNNLAERDVRMPKLKQKISGCFRSEAGADAFARVRGFISTTKKKGKGVFDGLASVFEGNAEGFLYPGTE